MDLTLPSVAMAKKDKNERMCRLARKGKVEKAGELAKGAKYICGNCFRAAADEANLCKPTQI